MRLYLSFSLLKFRVLSSRAIMRAISRCTLCIFMAVMTNMTVLAAIIIRMGIKKYTKADHVSTEIRIEKKAKNSKHFLLSLFAKSISSTYCLTNNIRRPQCRVSNHRVYRHVPA